MVVDGRASAAEKARLVAIMRRAGASWQPDLFAERIREFIADAQKSGFKTVLFRCLRCVELFRSIGQGGVLLKCVDSMANADGMQSERERVLLRKIRETLLR
jgi:uncharacterized tellurite resistance protein B-like protein